MFFSVMLQHTHLFSFQLSLPLTHTHINNMAQGVISYFRVFVYCMRYMGHQLSQWEWFTLLI